MLWRVTKDFLRYKSRVKNASYHTSPIVSIQFLCLYDMPQKIKHESLREKINWDIKMFSWFFVLKRQSFFFRRGKSQKVTGILLKYCAPRYFVGGAVYQIFSLLRSRALLLTKQHVKKEYQNIFIPPRRFSDFVAWSLSLNLWGKERKEKT